MSSLCELFPCSKYSGTFYFKIFADSVHWKIAKRWKFLSGVFLYTNTFINIKYFSVEKIFKILNISIQKRRKYLRLLCSLSSKTLQLEWFMSGLQEIRKKSRKSKIYTKFFFEFGQVIIVNITHPHSDKSQISFSLRVIELYIFRRRQLSVLVAAADWRQFSERKDLESNHKFWVVCKGGSMDSFNTFIANKSITKSLVWSRSRSLHYGNLGDLGRSQQIGKR